MEQVLSGLLWKKALVYLDDVMVFGSTWEIALQNLREVFMRFRKAGLKLKPSKCFLLRQEVDYLGHVVSKDGIKADPKKVSAVKNWPAPRTVKQVRGFLGMANYYRRFINNFSEKVAPMTALLRKNTKFVWTNECQEAFDIIKEALCTTPILAYPTRTDKFVLDTDASKLAIGAVLSQVQNGVERVIAYGSKTLNKAERAYCTTKRELLAVVHFVQQYRPYLTGRPFTIRTDHASLKWLKNYKDGDDLMARWNYKLDTFDYEIVHRPGKEHANADSLSRITRRCPREDCPECSLLKRAKNKKSPKDDADIDSDLDVCHEEVVAVDAPVDTAPRRSKRLAEKKLQQEHAQTRDKHKDTAETRSQVRTARRSASNSCVKNQKDTLPHDSGDTTRTEIAKTCNDTAGAREDTAGAREDTAQTSKNITKTRDDTAGTCNDTPQTHDASARTLSVPWLSQYTRTDWLHEQEKDDTLREVMNLCKRFPQKKLPLSVKQQLSPDCRQYLATWNDLYLAKDGVLHRNVYDELSRDQIVVPASWRKDVMTHVHAGPLGGHLGYSRTYPVLRQRFFWCGMSRDYKNFLAACHSCAVNKKGIGAKTPGLKQDIATHCWERIAVDVMGPYETTTKGNQWVVVMQDYFSKWIEIYCVPDHQAPSMARCLMHWVSHYGCPLSVHADQGREFESRLYTDLCKLLMLRKTRTNAYTPWGDGMVERANRTVKTMINHYTTPGKANWDEYMDILAGAYRATVHTSTGYTPNMLVLGRETTYPMDVAYGLDLDGRYDLCPHIYVEELRERLERVWKHARQTLKRSAELQQRGFPPKMKGDRKYAVGDLVYKFHPPARKGKLGAKWIGPLPITQILDPWVVVVKDGQREYPVNVRNIKPKVKELGNM